jgi:hypothetical protein
MLREDVRTADCALDDVKWSGPAVFVSPSSLWFSTPLGFVLDFDDL